MSIENLSKLSFFKVGRYKYEKENICDFKNVPRPHFCMGLLIAGEAVFEPEDGEAVHISPGDIVFVPITSRYRSIWTGSPDILYISMHFAFEPMCGISENNHFALQKIKVDDFDRIKEKYIKAYECSKGDTAAQMQALGILFDILSGVLPMLKQKAYKPVDDRIDKVVEYINLHSEENISIPNLAKIAGMSVPNFHLQFKKNMNMSPIEYKNHISIGRAMRLLKSDKTTSIEEISEMLGFESATYFRRLFKKHTGKSPREYRNSKIEI